MITNVTCNMPHCVAKAPAFPNTPLWHLKQAYGAFEFLLTLKTFTEKHIPHAIIPNKYDHFDVYNAIHLTLPSQPHISNRKHQKTIHATPKHNNGPRKQPSPACFNTALVIKNANLYHEDSGLCGMYKLFPINLTNDQNCIFRLTCCQNSSHFCTSFISWQFPSPSCIHTLVYTNSCLE